MYDLSVIIPGNNEMWMAQTVADLVKNKRGKTEVIVVLDSRWAEPGIEQHPDVNVIYTPTVIGQRAATNLGARLSKAKYVAKADAHCSFDEGFDVKMMDAFKEVGDNVTMVPIMRNLHVFDWKCLKCGARWYQGPTPTTCMSTVDRKTQPNPNCNSTKFERKITWEPRRGTYSTSYCFDAGHPSNERHNNEPAHFQYFPEYKHRPEYEKAKTETGLTETMSLQGSFFMCTREKYWQLKISDEDFGSWGNQGIEVAGKTWLSGGRVLVNHRTWYAHLFRTQGGDFGFPYEKSGWADLKTKWKVWEYFFGGRFKQQIHPMSWLVEKFWPVPGWNDDQLRQLKEKEKTAPVK